MSNEVLNWRSGFDCGAFAIGKLGMRRSTCTVVLVVLFSASTRTAGEPPGTTGKPVSATVGTTLTTALSQIRQFAFDGDATTFFASDKNPASSDHFTFVFDKPVKAKSIAVITGRTDGSDALEHGTLEVSPDAKAFHALAQFADGKTKAAAGDEAIKAVRIQPAANMKHPLAIRELTIESDPPVAVFKYPVEFHIDVADEPRLKGWAENVARICAREYPMINEALKSDGYKPPTVVTLAMKRDYRGVAFASGSRITGSVTYFQDHPSDVGAMVHEAVHVVQHYNGRGNPEWLVEGVSDYIRFFKFERGRIGRINPERAHYDGSYRLTATFLAYVTDKYDKQLVRKLNKIMREGRYKKEIFQELTGKNLEDLDEEWRSTLKR
jgi:Peptidase of plants and bacteria